MNIKKISSISLITLLSINLVACSLNTQQSNNIPQNLNDGQVNTQQTNNTEQNLNDGQANTQQANNTEQNLNGSQANTQQANNTEQNLNGSQANTQQTNNTEQNLNGSQANTQQADNIPQTLGQNNIKISRDKAKEIALKEVPNSQIVSYEEDLYEYLPKYEIELIDNNGYKYDLSISAIDGKIIEYEKESIYKY